MPRNRYIATRKKALISGLSFLFLAACSQAPVRVEQRGEQFFGAPPKIAARELLPSAAPHNNAEFHTQSLPNLAPTPKPTAPAAPAPASSPTLAPSSKAPMETQPGAAIPNKNTASETKPIPTPVQKAETSLSPAPQTKPLASESAIPTPAQRPGSQIANSYTLPTTMDKSGFSWPVSGPVISEFGPKQGGLRNDGINISATEGAPIFAPADGLVVYTGSAVKGYGNLTLIQHDKQFITAYAHQQSYNVKKGESVKRGQLIGYVGRTGNTTEPQLHFSIRKGKEAVNPIDYLPRQVTSIP